jgi:hypothetical protein
MRLRSAKIWIEKSRGHRGADTRGLTSAVLARSFREADARSLSMQSEDDEPSCVARITLVRAA